MTKTTYYKYLGTNGVITSPVHLEDVYYVRLYLLEADNGKFLTKDNQKFVSNVMVSEDEFGEWQEVSIKTK